LFKFVAKKPGLIFWLFCFTFGAIMAGWKFFINNIQVNEPIGFDAIEFTAIRLESHGIDQPFSTEISFSGKPGRYGNGAKILKEYFENGFINDQIPFQITSNQNIDGSTYDFNGFINMALYSEQNTCDTQGWQITVGIIENDFKEVFMARQDVEIDLLTLKDLDQNTIDPIDFTEVRLHSQELYLQGFCSQLVNTQSVDSDEDVVWPLYWDNSDFKGVFGSSKDPTGLSFSTTNVIFINNGDFTRTFTLNGYLKCRVSNGVFNANDMIIRMIKYPSGGGTATVVADYAYTAVPIGETRIMESAVTNLTFTLAPGESFQVLHYLTTALDRNVYFEFPEENYLTWTELNQVQASTCNGLYIFNFLKRILHIITGNANPLVSDYFSVDNAGLMWNNLITTGLYIRNGQLLDQANPQITTSFKGFFEDLSNIFNLGWGFEYNETLSVWQIRIEPMEYFYNAGIQIAEFNKVSNITQYAQVEDLVNSFQLGFTDDWKNIAVSGMFEPHTYRSYFTPNKSRSAEKKVLDLRSDIIGSGYAIEFSRRLQYLRDDSGSSDRPNDYNLFIIWLNRASVTIPSIANTGYEFPGETGSVTFLAGTVSVGSDLAGSTNAPIGEIYNILHTPARIAARWWKYLGMNTFGLPTAKAALFFQSGEYYTALESEIDSAYFPVANQEITGMVSEKTNISKAILQSDINAYLFKPIGLDFSVPQSLCSFIDMANNGIGIIKMTSGNQSFYGFLQNATNKPVDPKSGISNFKLLLANNVPYVAGFSEGFSDGFG
jgi:hypothetical protein